MTAKLPISPEPVKPSPLRLFKWGAGLLLGAAAAWFLWQWAHDMSGVRREAPKVPMIIPLPPPPPPPPPEPEKPKEPEPPVEEKVPEPTPEPEDIKPQEEAPPSPADDLANPMQIDGDAQAGGDAFNIGAGKGGGMAGSGGGGLGTGTYKQYLAATLQRLLRDDPDLRRLAFSVQVDFWLSADGDVLKVAMVKGTGEPKIDERIIASLQNAPRFRERTPASLTLPIRVSLKGRRPD
ncbi:MULTISPECIES: energy transducer TonB [Pseudomonas]|uniref:Outer membrane transport energization protein TonB n=1 Tax=Pseudomonas asplenii TaxID=53407 RepID=A0A0N1J642_9PSED|nr:MULTISPECIES: energy transducer TonB [Pseudomonas]KPA91973.1 outer membrane transport energization protein TonB [Pseudomonas fuscovaginae]KPA98512.1 outer membrane transport energization protein TonB [Pseudomonas fuscovaginae]